MTSLLLDGSNRSQTELWDLGDSVFCREQLQELARVCKIVRTL